VLRQRGELPEKTLGTNALGHRDHVRDGGARIGRRSRVKAGAALTNGKSDLDHAKETIEMVV